MPPARLVRVGPALRHLFQQLGQLSLFFLRQGAKHVCDHLPVFFPNITGGVLPRLCQFQVEPPPVALILAASDVASRFHLIQNLTQRSGLNSQHILKFPLRHAPTLS